MERSVSDRFSKRYESTLNTLSEQKLQRNLVLVNDLLKSKESVANSVTDRASIHTRNAAFEAVSAPEQCCSSPLLKRVG